jgi:hypothetical protein
MIAVAEPPAIIRKATPSTATFFGLRLPSYEAQEIRLVLNFGMPLTQIRDKISRLHEWEDGWNGYDVAAPKKLAVNQALRWIEEMYNDVHLTSKQWKEPHIAASEDGDVLLEWWNGNKGLSVYISEESVTYIKDWGPNILHEMEDGVVSSPAMRRQLWHWLMD